MHVEHRQLILTSRCDYMIKNFFLGMNISGYSFHNVDSLITMNIPWTKELKLSSFMKYMPSLYLFIVAFISLSTLFIPYTLENMASIAKNLWGFFFCYKNKL